MGQIVRSINGISPACKFLDYPDVSGNVSLYNETDSMAIKPTPAIGGVGLLRDLNKRCDSKFKEIDDEIFLIGNCIGHLSCSLFEREILKNINNSNPPTVDLNIEKIHGEFVREIIDQSLINACHDISDGGLLIALFEMSNPKMGLDLDISALKSNNNLTDEQILFGEDQGRYIISTNNKKAKDLQKKADKSNIPLVKIGKVISQKIIFNNDSLQITDLIKINEALFEKKFS
jgi:phosphoribosylformylglycinamidine synthase